MNEKIIVPALGESITEATVSKWLKKVGEKIEADEPLVELETDKVSVEVPSPIDGILSEIKTNNGQTVKVGSELGMVRINGNSEKKTNIDTSSTNIKNSSPEKEEKFEEKFEEKIKEEKFEEKIKEEKFEEKIIKIKNEKNSFDEMEEEKPLILTDEMNDKENINNNVLSPSVRKIVEEKKINIQNIQGTGKGGRILKGDLIHLMGASPSVSERQKKYGPEEIIKMTRLRLTIARRLKEAQNNAAMLTTFNEVNMHNIIEMRTNYQNEFQKEFSIKLGFMSFFVKACIVGLKNFPAINAEINGEEIKYKNYYNISFAVGTKKGLVVPVIKNADQMSFADIEKNIKILSEKAHNGKISIEDLQGGTFTISNGGVYGSMLSTPILNLPQSAVLGMHNIVERPVVENNEIVSRPIMYLALSYDHRIIDGKEAVSFLKTIKECLEEPRRLFLDL